MLAYANQGNEQLFGGEPESNVKVNIQNEEQLKRLQAYIAVLSKNFKIRPSEPDLLITISPKRNSISFQFGKYLDYSNFSFEVFNVKIEPDSKDDKNLAVNLHEFSVALSNITSDNLTISLDTNNMVGLEMQNNTYEEMNIIFRDVQVYAQEFEEELKFIEVYPKWKFELKNSNIQSFKNLLKVAKNKNFEYIFTITKLNSNNIVFNLYIDNFETTYTTFLPITNIHDNYLGNHFAISYNVFKIKKIFSCIKSTKKSLIFSVDEDLNLMIEEEDEKNGIRTRGRFPTVEQN